MALEHRPPVSGHTTSQSAAVAPTTPEDHLKLPPKRGGGAAVYIEL
jgi:hypothetical protein